jgi:hypothetical protein
MRQNIFKFIKFVTTLSVFTFTFIWVTQGEDNNIFQNLQSGLKDEIRKIENRAFTIGEWLKFDVSYGFIHAGTAIMSVPEYRYINDRKCYYVKTEAYSASGFSWIFKVEDKYETYIDVEGLFPWRFEQHIREGSYKADNIAQFDQINHIATTKDNKYSIPEYVHDIVSAFYFARTQNFSGFRAGQKIYLKNFYKDKVYPLDVKYLGKMQVEVDAGKFDCIVVEPLVKEGGLFKHQGRLLIWLTDDDRKIPVKVITEIIVGSLTIELKSFSGINGPIDAKR